LFLLACPPDRRGAAGGRCFGLALNAAALQSLLDQGFLTDEDGKAHAVQAPRRAPAGRLEADLLDRIAAARRPRPWRYWVAHRDRIATGLVRDDLDAAHVLRVEPTRRFVFFTVRQVTVRRPEDQRAAAAARLAALRGTSGGAPHDAAVLAVFAHHGRLPRLATRSERRAARSRIADLAARIGGPVPDALHRAVRARITEEGAAAQG
jgi:hypothetical protein